MPTWKPPADLKAILFDKDGTLVDFDSTWQAANRKAAHLAANGDAQLAETLMIACGMEPATGKTLGDSLFAAANSSEIAEHMIALGSPFAQSDLTEKLDALFALGAENPVPLCDLTALFETLADAGLHLGIASSDSEHGVRRTAEVLSLDHRIAFTAGYDSGHGVKPEPGMIDAFCATLKIEPRHMIMVGDNRHDLAMARAAGAGGAIAVLSGTGEPDALADLADICLENVAELPRVLGL